MREPRIFELVEEIHDLYLRQCEYASRINSAIEADARKLKAACRARANPSFPELEHFGNVFACRDALQRAREDPQVRRRMKIAQTLNWIMVCGLCLVGVLYTGSYIAMVAVGVVCGGSLMVVEHRFVFRPHIHRCLREQLVERGVPICISCGYDLRGQIVPRCPECGTPCASSLLNVKAGVATDVER